MQVTVSTRDENNIVTITLETEQGRAKSEYEKILKRLGQNISIKGFRKGKAPTKMIEEYYSPEAIRAETLNENFINQLLQEAFKTENLNVIHIPAVERIEFEDPEDKILIEAKIELFPDVKLADYKDSKIQVKIPKNEVDKEVNDTLNRISLNYATFTESDSAIEMGDEIVFDFDGEYQKADGSYEAKPGMKAEDFQTIVEPGRFIDNFLEQTVGMKNGDEKTLEVKFPDAYHDEDLKGCNARFKVKIKKISKPTKPELNDEFAKNLGLESVADLKSKIKEEVEKLAENNKRHLTLETLFEEILPKSQLNLSKSMIQRELDYELAVMQHHRNWSDDQLKEFIQTINVEEEEEAARKKLERSVFLTSIIKQEKLEVNPDEVREAASKLQLPQGYDESKLDYKKLFQNIVDDLLTKKAVDHLISQIKVEYVEVDPTEIKHHVHGPNCNH